jgi:DNA-binding XRE family transcriptional regulator
MKSIKVEKALKKIGLDLKNARRKRLMPVNEAAQRIGISRQTLNKMESGKPGTAIEKYLTAYMLFEKIDDFANILDDDQTGNFMMEERILPKRIRSQKYEKDF